MSQQNNTTQVNLSNNTQANVPNNTAIDVVQQLSQKQPPSNQQISELVDTTQQFIDQKKNDPQFDQKTLKTVTDFQGVLEATKQLNENKNYDESLQNIMLETGAAAKEVGQQGQQMQSGQAGQIAQEKGQQLQQQGQQLTSTVWAVIKQMVRSGEFRGQVNSFVGIVQELLSGESADNNGQLSEEKKHEISSQLLAFLRKMNQTPQLKNGLNEIITILKDLEAQKENPEVQGQASQLKDTVQSSDHVDSAFSDSKKMVERFSQHPVDPFLVKNKMLFQYIRTNERVRTWFDQFVQLLSDSVQKPEELNEQEFTQRIEKLTDEANAISREPEFKSKYVGVISELITIVASIKDDPDLQNLQQQTANFLDNFTYTDANGQKQFNTDLVQQLRQFIVPLFIAQLDQIPIPPIEGSNDDYDYYFDNMVLSGQEIIPDMIEMHTRNDMQLNVNQMSADQAETHTYIQISNIKTRISDIHFKFARKTFPKLSDEGVANVRVEGNSGISLRLAFDLFMENETPRIKLSDVNCNIDKLKIDVVSAKHDFLLKLFASVYQTRAKKMIEKNVEQKIRESFAKIEGGLNDLFARYPPSRLKDAVSQKANQAINSGLNAGQSTQQNQQAIQS